MGDWNARGSRGRSLCVWRVSRGISEVLRRLQNGRIQKRKWFGNWNLFFFRNGRIRRRFEAKEPDKILYCSGVFLGTFLTLVLAVSARRVSLGGVDALNHREMRRKARRERPLFSAIFCGVEREERYGYRYLLKKCHLSGRVLRSYEGDARAERRPHSFGSNPSALLIL